MNNNIFPFLEEQIQTLFEARLGRKQELKNRVGQEDFGDRKTMFAKAAELIQERTGRSKTQPVPGNLQFTTEDIIFILNEVKKDDEFMAGIKTAKQLSDAVIQVCFDVLAIANAFVEQKRWDKNYKGKLAYDVADEDRSKVANAIKVSLNAIYALTKKRIKLEKLSDTQTLVLRKVINYIMSKSSGILSDLKSIELDMKSTNPKVKAQAISNMKNLEKMFKSKDAVSKIFTAFDVVKKYSGSDSLIWPTLPVKIEPGDDYASLFKYLDAYVAGKDIKHAQKWTKQFKMKSKAELKRKILINDNFRRQLKGAVRANKIDKQVGGEQTIKNLQSIAKKLMQENPEFVNLLQSEEGIKATAVDEIVGLLAQFIRVGALEVKVE